MTAVARKKLGTRVVGPSRRPPAQRRTQEERRAETRRKLIESAIDCICERGYAGTTAALIATRAGVTRGAVQHHFGNREDLFIAVVNEFGKILVDRTHLVERLIGRPIAERVDTAVDQYWESFSDRHFVASVLIWLGTRNVPALYPFVAKTMDSHERNFDRYWQTLFSDANCSPAEIAAARHLAFSALRGLAIRKVYRNPTASWADELALLKKMLTATLGHGKTKVRSPRGAVGSSRHKIGTRSAPR